MIAGDRPLSRDLDHGDKNLSLLGSPLPRGQGAVALARDMTEAFIRGNGEAPEGESASTG